MLLVYFYTPWKHKETRGFYFVFRAYRNSPVARNESRFDKVWHKGLIFKLKSNGVDGSLLKLMENYLTGRQQRIDLNGQTSSWKNILAGVPQGSVLGPLLFLIYVNDLRNGIESICKIFADDTSLVSKVKGETFSDTQLNNDLNKISK